MGGCARRTFPRGRFPTENRTSSHIMSHAIHMLGFFFQRLYYIIHSCFINSTRVARVHTYTVGVRWCCSLPHFFKSTTTEHLFRRWCHHGQAQGCLISTRNIPGTLSEIYPNFRPFVGSHRPSCEGPFAGRVPPEAVGTAAKRIGISGVHIPGPTLARVGVGAAKGSSE